VPRVRETLTASHERPAVPASLRTTLHTWADELVAAGCDDEAVAVFSALQELDAFDVRAGARLRRLYRKGGNARELSHQWLVVALHRQRQKRPADARRCVDRALQIDPQRDREIMGDIYLLLREWEPAVCSYAIAASRVGSRTDADAERVRKKLKGMLAYSDTMARRLWAAADQRPGDADTLKRILWVFYCIGRTADQAEAHARLADCWATKGPLIKALAELFGTIRLAPPERRPVYFARRAGVYAKLGLEHEAREDRVRAGLAGPTLPSREAP
jgi:tetratricopeptide (TPR) repeat protein